MHTNQCCVVYQLMAWPLQKVRNVAHSAQEPPTSDDHACQYTTGNPKTRALSIIGVAVGAPDLGRTTEISSVICRGRGTLAYRHRNDCWGLCRQPFGRGAAF